MTLKEWLKTHKACSEGSEFILNSLNLQTAWDTCSEPHWMYWLIEEIGLMAEIRAKVKRAQYKLKAWAEMEFKLNLNGASSDIEAIDHLFWVNVISLKYNIRHKYTRNVDSVVVDIVRVHSAIDTVHCNYIREEFKDCPLTEEILNAA